MQREIKFRGQRVDTKELVYGYYYCFEKKHYIHVVEQFTGGASLSCVEVIPETVGQYTGLNDKNSKEIYEGDIVSFDCYAYDEPENTYTGEVVYSNGNACFCLNGESESGKCEYVPLCEIGGSYITFVEVLGNIYDNPELLQEVE